MTQSTDTYRTGLQAETLAVWWLRLKAYRILAQRYKTPVGEVDVIARRGNTLVFIEVKARPTAEEGLHAVRGEQQQRILRAAEWFVQQHPQQAGRNLRFDVMVIPGKGWPIHLCNAFTA